MSVRTVNSLIFSGYVCIQEMLFYTRDEIFQKLWYGKSAAA